MCTLPVLLLAGILSPARANAKAFTRPHMHRPGHGCQIPVGPVTVERGTELTECTYLKFPSKKDMSVHRVKIKVSGGSHHVHIYRAADPTMSPNIVSAVRRTFLSRSPRTI